MVKVFDLLQFVFYKYREGLMRVLDTMSFGYTFARVDTFVVTYPHTGSTDKTTCMQDIPCSFQLSPQAFASPNTLFKPQHVVGVHQPSSLPNFVPSLNTVSIWTYLANYLSSICTHTWSTPYRNNADLHSLCRVLRRTSRYSISNDYPLDTRYTMHRSHGSNP